MSHLDVSRALAPLVASVHLPGSKSITNRALLLAARATSLTRLTGLLFADDTRQMLAALTAIGYLLHVVEPAREVQVQGMPLPAGRGQVLACGNSGTTLRFLLAALALAPRSQAGYLLDGIARMRERPIGELVDQLRILGAEIAYTGREGYPPLLVRGGGLQGVCSFSDAKSSQYISAILMAGPQNEQGIDVGLLGAVTSEPYVLMTLRMMEQFGVRVDVHDLCGQSPARILRVPAGRYAVAGGTYAIEPDASNASYFWALGALLPGSRIRVAGLGRNSLQGDVRVAEVLGDMGAAVTHDAESITVAAPPTGVLRGVERDMNAIPDMVQTIAVAALFAEGRTLLKNVWNLRVKETDRLAALETELRKFGATVETGRDWISIDPPGQEKLAAAGRVEVATYEDHRMAMAFAVAGVVRGDVRILDPGCTAKTYPEFFEDLATLVGSGRGG